MDTIMVQLTHSKALQLLQDLEELKVIRLFKSREGGKGKLSDKYKGVISKEEGRDLNRHINQMRNEWSNS